ncbi:Photosystem I reaction center subunit chloroplastic [Micractinium conductrix]|uniref:PSI-K n=1 Tax=Micractinium conductrix TaxID=554055 RepID=A0A2P6VR29_9CHLO|nr:Photosystem I reaction center subunit chloroplastic [Micractinium conductrix]|eukprot:PSC76542.1 Photosystem I reaction center subunit chloroplastic [Micractinium conductrix]
MQAVSARSFVGQTVAARPVQTRQGRRSVVVRADYLGSTTNQIMVLSTMLPLVAGRFGLAPTSTRHTNAGVKLLPQDKSAGLMSNDPAGFNAVDVLALGAFGHIFGVGLVLGLKGTGNL